MLRSVFDMVHSVEKSKRNFLSARKIQERLEEFVRKRYVKTCLFFLERK